MSRIISFTVSYVKNLDNHDVTTFFVFLLTFLLVSLCTRRRPGVPPGPLLFPVIGNLHCVATRDVTKKLASLRTKYGDVFSLYIGRELTIFLNGYDVIHEALMKRGFEFSCRPISKLNELTFIQHGFLMHNGQRWKEQRKFMKISLQHLCFRNKGKYIEKLMNREVFHLVEKIKSFPRTFDIKELFNVTAANIISTLMYSHRFDFDDEQVHTLLDLGRRSGVEYMEKEILMNCLPFLAKLPVDVLGIEKKKLKEFFARCLNGINHL